MAVNPLAGKPLRYAIGAEDGHAVLDGGSDVVTEVGYDYDVLPLRGIGIAYCNLFNEKWKEQSESERAKYGPYLNTSDTARQYKEGQIDPAGRGWEINLREQFGRRRSQGFEYIELDNSDAYSIEVVIAAINLAFGFGLKVIAKNPGLMKGDKTRIVAHPNVFGIIVERDCGRPSDMDVLRRAALKGDLPVWFVAFGSGRAWANSVAAEIRSAPSVYANMSATFDSHPQEYGGNITDLALPVVASPAISPSPTERPSMAVPPASNRIWRGDATRRVARSLLMLYDQVDSMLPSSRKAGNDGTIGDPSHQARASDHNANDDGIVTALDITHDPASGFDADAFAESFRRVRDRRLKYVIWRGRIFGDEDYARRNGAVAYEWAERNKGPGDHSEHVHISVDADPALADDPRPWLFDLLNLNSPRQTESTRRKLQMGDSGPDVVELQTLLGVEADSFFGAITKQAVEAFQARNSLFVDGIVGSHTWGLLTESGAARPSASSASPLATNLVSRISALVTASPLARYAWNDRTVAPIGYLKGMAVTYAYVYAKLQAGDSSARVMAAQTVGDTERDALAWYGFTNISAGPSTLRALFALLTGLGMRESSGNYSEGRDMSASNTSADTAEAGLFQQSWNSNVASPEFDKLFRVYAANSSDGFLSIFREGVSPKSTDDFGSGEGMAFQHLCKTKPAFAVECAAVGLRVLRKHWGPINRREAEVRPEVDALLIQVQSIVDAAVVPPEPEPQMPDPQIFPPGTQIPGQPFPQVDWNAILQQAVQAAIQAALPSIMAAVQQRLGQMPLALPPPVFVPPIVQAPPVVAPPVKDATVTPIMQKPTVIAGIAGLIMSLAGTYFGIVPQGVGEVAVAGSGALAALGSTSIFGMAQNLISGFLQFRRAQKAAV